MHEDSNRGNRAIAAPPADVTGRPTLGHLPSLDGLRAVAVLIVMAFHAGLPGFYGGRAGVDVFFVLSGFLITALLLQEHESAATIRLGAFYMRRVLRLYPALVAAVLLSLVLAAARVPIFDSSWKAFDDTLVATPFALFYTLNIVRAIGWSGGGFLGHTWSLAIEEQFYLVWPVVVVLLLRRRISPAILGWVALACAVTSAGLRAALDIGGVRGELLYNATFSHVDGIFLGCAIAVVWRTRRDLLGRLAGRTASVIAIAAATAVTIHGQNMNVYGYLVIVLATGIVLAHLLEQRSSRLSLMLSHRAAVAIGKRSYGLYLYHWPIFLFLGIDTRPHVLALGFGGSFVAAWLSYRYVEQPFLRRKGRWSPSRATTHDVHSGSVS